MGPAELIGVAGSLSLLAGWRLYACVLAAGIAMRTGVLDLPTHLDGLSALANPWVMGIAGFGVAAEFLADKVMWLDTAWDAVHTLVRPVGGALLALAVVDPSDGAWQVATLLLGGGAALAAHGAKAGARGVVNASPEPFSNLLVSTTEDVATAGGLYLALAHPEVAVAVAAVVAVLVGGLLWLAWRVLGRVRRKLRRNGRSD